MKQKEVEMNDYIAPYPISKIRILDSCETLKRLVQEVSVPQKRSMLVTGINLVVHEEGETFFNALLEDIHNMSKKSVHEMYSKTEIVSESLVSELLLSELEHVKKVAKAEERGFFYDEKKKRFNFNANAFAKHFIKRCHVRSTKDGRIFLYNRKGVYEELSEVNLGKIIRTVMHEGRWNSWKSIYETEISKALQREAIIVDTMNADRNFINLKNGMLNLSTYVLEEHSPFFLSTVQLPIEYDSSAVSPKFLTFMQEITLNDAELIDVHQELIGYLLTGETKAEKAVYYFGRGANGKSVLATVITNIVGPANVSSVTLASFNDPFGMENLMGKSLNIAAENEMGGKALKTENFKAIVSGDNININIKYRPAISYQPFCRLVFLVNSLPDSIDVTSGYFRKLLIIPFRRTFSKDERNVNLKDELLEELPGILNWAIEGLIRLKQNSYQFSHSKTIEECHRSYYVEQNPVKEFFQEHVSIVEGARTKQADFYQIYLRWLHVQGIDDKGTKSRQVFWRYFKVILESENISVIKKKVRGTIYFDGMKVEGLDDLQPPTLSGDIIQF
ncbi:DNA primase family protein [Paraliobacillus zengyii]|uniref:DNA primase family protein n=1 Tax=Paraliobacillus zengyii TaxID=2213194 RepID=UPI000DD44C66|nr:DNA primase family protein [Paraliobacillus zengyii]